MSRAVITVEHLSKSYRIGRREAAYRTFREAIVGAVKAPIRRFQRLRERGNGDDTFWALKDVSFEVQEGEVVGIIGRNGAGKTTLLKILSRITEPTEGRAVLRGRVASLLEVGTGFHPELTGRENIYLNGAILGMKKAEIDRKFDEIVAFAEVEKFLDTPVKRYSSGMYVRLAFAVAAHLDPEILVVDEVLAVGDAEFQRKCVTKMQTVARGGRTILFVSHNMSAICSICGQGIVLHQGVVIAQGTVPQAVDCYQASLSNTDVRAVSVETEGFRIEQVAVRSARGRTIRTFDPVDITVRFTAKLPIGDPGLYVGILTADHQRVTGLDFKDFTTVPPLQAGEARELGFSIQSLPLLPGTYQLDVYLKDMATHRIEQIPAAFTFDVAETAVYGGRKLDRWYGSCALHARPLDACTITPPAEGSP